MPSAHSSKPLKVSENLATILHDVDALLPKGAYARIGEMVNKSDEYVRLFFKGFITISERNIKILDAADKYIEKVKQDEGAKQEARHELEEKATAKAEAIKNNIRE